MVTKTTNLNYFGNLDDEFLFDEKMNKEFRDPLEHYEQIVEDAKSRYQRTDPG